MCDSEFTDVQQDQIAAFYELITEDIGSLQLERMVDTKGVERLAICVIDEEKDRVMAIGVLFSPNDPLIQRMEFIQQEDAILVERPAGTLQVWMDKVKSLFKRGDK